MKEFFTPAPAVEEIGRELIEEYHKHLLDHSVRVEFLFRSKTPVKAGRAQWGTARKVSGLNAHLRYFSAAKNDVLMSSRRELNFTDEEKYNEPFFLILISRPIWENIKDPQRRALVDHELMHLDSDYDDKGEIKLSIVGHDFEAFNREFELHGLWRDDAKKMLKTLKDANQLKLDFQPDKQPDQQTKKEPSPLSRPSPPLTETDGSHPVVVH